MPRVSDYVNAISAAGLKIESLGEPAVTHAFREVAPKKAAWMDRYVGILLFRAHAER